MSQPQGCMGALLGLFPLRRRRRPRHFSARLICQHCRAANIVAGCHFCDRKYTLTTAHIEGRMRDAAAGPVGHLHAVLIGNICDACIARDYARTDEAEAARTQRTCPACHQEFLSQHGL